MARAGAPSLSRHPGSAIVLFLTSGSPPAGARDAGETARVLPLPTGPSLVLCSTCDLESAGVGMLDLGQMRDSGTSGVGRRPCPTASFLWVSRECGSSASVFARLRVWAGLRTQFVQFVGSSAHLLGFASPFVQGGLRAWRGTRLRRGEGIRTEG